jgi:predicted RND superfamily exporter protein
LIDQVERIARQDFPAARATGVFVLFTDLIESLLRDQYVSLALATVGICSMMTLAFGSIRIGLLSLVPNLFPIVLVIGTMGWIGLPLNIATAMIASVSIGLTVDSSIHYLSGYRRARRRGLSVTDAIHATHGSVGRALVFANLALILGFTVLALSQFIPMVYFGILVSLAMLGGLIGNLILLPLLLHWVEEANIRRTSL